ncbi:response regulator [Nodosilinea sp. FACHB-131]|uniref:ATP-binding response regulator n=1 Tax=Cyanophyceae TaxID=3028117 RepID=UPI0016853E7F|nr:response regulator [Nodosilinea sp. FACHB-131]MBD1877039.1 response regulator [Nodosilinea sp. FACHB-131]
MPPELEANILLVDDRVENLIALEEILGRLGQKLVTAQSGKEALRCLLNQDFAAILLDVEMPGMDGFETASLIRQRERSEHTPIIFVTAFSTDDQLQMKGYALGAVDYLLKPINPEILISKVSVFVELFKKNQEIQRQSAELAMQKVEIIQEQLARQQAEAANRMKDEFMAIVSHELRTPLNAILGWSQLLVAGKLDEGTASRAIETINRNALSQAQLIDDILDVARLTSGKVKIHRHPVDLLSLISDELESIRPAANEKGIQLTGELTTDPCIVSGDMQRLQQILRNLLSNAIKFTPGGGQVEVGLKRIMGNESWITSKNQEPQRTTPHPLPNTVLAQITVTDTGIGIDSDFLPQIFEYFRQADSSSTRSHDGLGLGLAIVRQLVELHGGKIDAASEGKDKGTTFTISLPLPTPTQLDPSAETPNSESLPSDLALENISVLVVDDNVDNRNYLVTALELAGAQVTAVASGQEVIDYLQHSHPDVLLSDIAMPNENGYELLQRVRMVEQELGRTIPAIALTAYAKPEDRNQALSGGFQQFLSKPVDPIQLIEVVATAARAEVSKLTAL